jgi:hypothetical protein
MLILFSGNSFAQYVDDEAVTPFFGGAGDYRYPVVCGQCTVWQDYRNFAWNQLSLNGGFAHTPNNPGNITSFRIYTSEKDDLYPATVEISMETVDVVISGNRVGHTSDNGEHYFVETHPENGDNVDSSQFPKDMGPLQFPYQESIGNDPGNDDSNEGTDPPAGGSGGGGGDASDSGNDGGIYGGGGGGPGAGGNPGGGGRASRNYCGPGTEFTCVQY